MEQAELTKVENAIYEAVRGRFGDKILGHYKHREQFSILAAPEIIVELAEFMRDDTATDFKLLADITGVDWIEDLEHRFEIVYNFYSVSKQTRVLIRVRIADTETPGIDSLCGVYQGADWLECEVYDMLGIEFDNHPDLRRLLTPEGLEGWPHRKDFPLTYEEPEFTHNKDLPPRLTK